MTTTDSDERDSDERDDERDFDAPDFDETDFIARANRDWFALATSFGCSMSTASSCRLLGAGTWVPQAEFGAEQHIRGARPIDGDRDGRWARRG